MMRKAAVEAIGTFFFILTIGMVVIEPGAGAFAPLAIGSALMVMIYAGGHVSGGHFNPAVTLGVFLRGKAGRADLGWYWGAQVLGAIVAFIAVRGLKGGYTVTPMELAPAPALLAEFLFTFALVWVVLNVATTKANQGNSHYGLAIGFTVMVGAYAIGGISGCAINPAVAIGLTLMGVSTVANLWIYLVAELLAGVAAALVFNALASEADKSPA